MRGGLSLWLVVIGKKREFLCFRLYSLTCRIYMREIYVSAGVKWNLTRMDMREKLNKFHQYLPLASAG